MSAEPITLYRLWCGPKRHGGWRRDQLDAFRDGLARRVTFTDPQRGTLHLGPLAWIEVGQRKYARSRTVVVGRQG